MKDEVGVRIANSSNIPHVQFRQPSKQSYHFEIQRLEKVISIITAPSERKKRGSITPSPTALHRLNFHLLLLITDGTLHHQLDDQTVILKKNQTLMIHADQVHAFTFESRSPKGYMLFLSNDVWPELTESKPLYWRALHHPINTLTSDDMDSALPIFELLMKEQKKKDQERRFPYLALSALLNLLFENWPTKVCNQSPRSIKYYLNFQALLEKEFSKSRDANDYAEKLGLSYKTLNEICKTFTQKTAKAVIDEFVVLKAKRLLLTEHASILGISLSLGFQESSNFNKFFRRHVKQTPQEYRFQRKVRD